MNTLQSILAIIAIAVDTAAPIVAGNPEAAAADRLAQGLLQIAQAAAAAYQQHTGKPIDLAMLQPIDPVI